MDGECKPELDLEKEIAKIREKEKEYSTWSEKDFENNKNFVKKTVKKIVTGV